MYYEKKRFLQIYLCFAFFVSFFLFYSGNGSSVVGARSLTGAEMPILGGSFITFLFLVANNLNISISPAVALSISALLSIIGEYGTLPEQLQNFSFGLVDMWWCRIFVFVWMLLSVIPRCTQVTHIGGLLIEDLDHKMGQIATFIVVTTQVLANYNGGNTVQAATATMLSSGPAHSFRNVILCFMLLVAFLLCFVIVHTFIFFLDIIQIPLHTMVPFTSFINEVMKIGVVIFMFVLAVFAPKAFFVCYGILFLLAFLFFRKAYISVRYFKQIYAKPFFRKLRGYDKNIELVCPSAPRRIKQELKNKDISLLIPVYSVQKICLHSSIKKHDQCWLAVHSDQCHLYKVSLSGKQLQHVTLNDKIFLKDSLRFFEVFSLEKEDDIGTKSIRKGKKKWHFVYSNEYTYRLDDILKLTGFIEYNRKDDK